MRPNFVTFMYNTHLGLITGVLRHYFLDWSIFVGGRCVNFFLLPKLNYKKMVTRQKKVTIPLFYCCMLAKGYINLYKKFIGLRHLD